LKVGANTSTDEILPAGSRALPYRSNIPKLAEFAFDMMDETYPQRAAQQRDRGGHVVVGGENYGQGSSREHAALAPRFLGLRVVLAKSFARIHRQNLVNFGIIPLRFVDGSMYDRLARDETLRLTDLRQQFQAGPTLIVHRPATGETFTARHDLSQRQIELIEQGGLINWMKDKLGAFQTASNG